MFGTRRARRRKWRDLEVNTLSLQPLLLRPGRRRRPAALMLLASLSQWFKEV